MLLHVVLEVIVRGEVTTSEVDRAASPRVKDGFPVSRVGPKQSPEFTFRVTFRVEFAGNVELIRWMTRVEGKILIL